jgi:acyl carrier protein
MNFKTVDVVKNILIEELNFARDCNFDDVRYGDSYQWDSTSHLLLIIAMEDKFNIAIDSNDIVKMTDVKSIVSELAKYGVHDS